MSSSRFRQRDSSEAHPPVHGPIGGAGNGRPWTENARAILMEVAAPLFARAPLQPLEHHRSPRKDPRLLHRAERRRRRGPIVVVLDLELGERLVRSRHRLGARPDAEDRARRAPSVRSPGTPAPAPQRGFDARRHGESGPVEEATPCGAERSRLVPWTGRHAFFAGLWRLWLHLVRHRHDAPAVARDAELGEPPVRFLHRDAHTPGNSGRVRVASSRLRPDPPEPTTVVIRLDGRRCVVLIVRVAEKAHETKAADTRLRPLGRRLLRARRRLRCGLFLRGFRALRRCHQSLPRRFGRSSVVS